MVLDWTQRLIQPMDTVARPSRQGRARGFATVKAHHVPVQGDFANLEPPQTALQKKIPGSATKALGDITNTCTRTRGRSARTDVTKQGANVDEVVKNLYGHLPESARNKRRGKEGKVVSIPTATKEQEVSAFREFEIEGKDAARRSVSGRRGKEQKQVESKLGGAEVDVGEQTVLKGRATGKMKKAPKVEHERVISKATGSKGAKNTGKSKPEPEKYKLESDDTQDGPEQSAGRALENSYMQEVGVVDSKTEKTVTKRKRELASKPLDEAILEALHEFTDTGTEVTNKGKEMNVSMSSQGTTKLHRSVRKDSLWEKVKPKGQGNNGGLPSGRKSSIETSALSAGKWHMGSDANVVKQRRKGLLESAQRDLEFRETLKVNACNIAQLQMNSPQPDIEDGVKNLTKEKTLHQPKGRKGAGQGRCSLPEGALVKRNDSEGKTTNVYAFKEKQQIGLSIGGEIGMGLPVAEAQVRQTCRRNGPRAARKVINYAEVIDECTARVLKLHKETPLKRTVQNGQVLQTQDGVLAIDRTMRQTERKSKKLDAGVVRHANDVVRADRRVPEVYDSHNKARGGLRCQQDRITAPILNLESSLDSLEHDYEIFKRESKRGCTKKDDLRKVPPQTSRKKMGSSQAITPVRLPQPMTPRAECFTTSINVVSGNHAAKLGVEDQDQERETLKTKATRATKHARQSKIQVVGKKLERDDAQGASFPRSRNVEEKSVVQEVTPIRTQHHQEKAFDTKKQSMKGKVTAAEAKEIVRELTSDGMHNTEQASMSKGKVGSTLGSKKTLETSVTSVRLQGSRSECARSCIAEAITEMNKRLQTSQMPVLKGQKRVRKDTNDQERLATFVQLSEPKSIFASSKVRAKIADCSPLDENIKQGVLCKDQSTEVQVADVNTVGAVAMDVDSKHVEVSGHEIDLKALASFDDADVPTKVKECCKDFGKPSLLEAHAMPFLLAGRDLIGISESLAGQTMAYGVPAVVHALKKRKSYVRKRPSPTCLVLAPSPEVVQQITKSLDGSLGSLRVKVGSASGDPVNNPKNNTLKPGVAVAVTTPDTLLKMLEDGSFSLALVSFLVLDGADSMLHNGYETIVREILDQIPAGRQTAIFSSTWPSELEQLCKDFVPEAELVKVVIKNHEGVPLVVEKRGVTQIVEVLEDAKRDTRLTALLHTFQKGNKNSVLVYVLYKEEALHVEKLLQQRGWKVATVHGGIFETDRTEAIISFQNGATSVLVATDVAARGLAIPYVDYIINYSFPYTPEDYALRLGHIGKTGRRGIMHTFFTPANQAQAKELVEMLREAEQDVPEELLKFTSPANKKPRIAY